ncbi:hypothetical protein OG381_38275 [Streptomyces sp. NBC_00490]|uniref:hypothetical protein n=1 Tax=Streptomyces sp. NBC_00490 TaxID=2903657 RepID=UPI002E175090
MPASVSSPRVGVRLIGSRGSVATTVVTGHDTDDCPLTKRAGGLTVARPGDGPEEGAVHTERLGEER